MVSIFRQSESFLLMESFNFLGLLKVNFDAFLDIWKNLGIQDGRKVPAIWK